MKIDIHCPSGAVKKTMAALMLTMMLVLSAAAADVSYLGPAGTYTEEAAQFFFQNGETLNPKETVNDAIADLLSGEANYAVIPQENTLGGAVVNYTPLNSRKKTFHILHRLHHQNKTDQPPHNYLLLCCYYFCRTH